MKKLLILIPAIALCAMVFPHLFARAQDQSALGQDTQIRQEQDLAKFFRKHERLKLYTAEVAEQVRQNRPVAIYTPGAAFDLRLKPHDMRGRNYRAVEVGADGVEHAVKMGAVRTYKGEVVVGRDDAQARFTVDDETFEGLIVTPEERYMIEPARKYSAAADQTDFVLYRASDVIGGREGLGEEPIDYELRHTAEDVAPQVNDALAAPEAVATTVRDIELATEADAEYVTALGGTSQAANDEIMSVMNMVEGIYQQELNLTFTVVFQHTWTNAAADPYSATAPGGCYNNVVCGPNPPQIVPKGILNEFMEYWNTNFPPGSPSASNPRRDVAHMWTGKDVDGSVVGLAWLNVVCSTPTYSYGFSQRLATAPQKYVVPAHEIGHNLSASHSDNQTGCANTIMNSWSSPNSLLQFCSYSINQITTYVNANSGCLAAVSCSYTISPTSKSFTSTGGSDRVSVTSGCAWTATSNAAWISITAGASGVGNGAVSYTVAPNTATTSRTGTLTVAGQTFTVTQSAAAAPALSAVRLSRSLVPGCMTVTGTVTLTAAAPVGGLIVTLSDNIAATSMPASVTLTEGATSKTFTITTVPVTANQAGSVTAKLGTVTKSATLTVRPMRVQTLTLSPNPVVGPNSVTGTAILECLAPASGIVVALSSTDTAVAAPTVNSITIPASTKSKTFTVRTADVSVSSSAIIKATANGNTKTRTLTVN
jgi:hypothetical protein